MDVTELQNLALRSEAEIMLGWEQGPDKPLVSISCCTFNHEPYIETALKGFLIQETSFPFEILVHDDASTDRTADIIRTYHERYPNIIKPIVQVENQYSQGNKPGRINSKRALGNFRAVCEGDDCWIDSSKLQRQVDGLQEHPGIDICFHSATKMDYSKGGAKTLIGRYADTPTAIIPVDQIILRPHGLIPTASILFRREVLTNVQKFREGRKYLAVGDIYLFFFGAMRGGALYLDRNMSLYRAKLPGSWTLKNSSDYEKRMQGVSVRVRSYVELDESTHFQHTSALKRDNRLRVMGILKENNIPLSKKLRFYRQHAQSLDAKNKLISLLVVFGSPLWYKLKSI